MRFLTLFFKAALAPMLGLYLVTQESMATDWPQFRGPNRDGIWNETGILESFPKEGVKIRWRHPVVPGGIRGDQSKSFDRSDLAF